ncbi:hypothetical protein Pla175_08460 [Pirellulimonas nuda]|uniref:Putative restriction endonuclease domain-containing protein n=1 Tax=Pirellulimonas nuda TaxID=2528009 RepID=A0A518D7M2_9BACT|nr:Uma2 family endonuclease [Pirellulimonas nuda]QDU87484.1 hypothetical protein Pla175_08460 [Pirellulimonas nuda]
MAALRQYQLISVDEYLAGELTSDVKHEYLGGHVYAMAGARNAHNLIAGNFFLALGVRLRSKPCQPFNSDTKVKIYTPTQTRFYYPDGMVVCSPNPQHDSHQDQPVVVAEVLSKSSRRTDEGEKLDYYRMIPSLRVYLVIEQEEPRVVAHRRVDQGFAREEHLGLDAVIPLPEIAAELPLAELYQRVEFSPEPDDDPR